MCVRVFALVWKDLEKPEVEIFGIPEVEIPEMDLYILRDLNVGIDAGNGAAGWNSVSYKSAIVRSLTACISVTFYLFINYFRYLLSTRTPALDKTLDKY